MDKVSKYHIAYYANKDRYFDDLPSELRLLLNTAHNKLPLRYNEVHLLESALIKGHYIVLMNEGENVKIIKSKGYVIPRALTTRKAQIELDINAKYSARLQWLKGLTPSDSGNIINDYRRSLDNEYKLE